MMPAQYFCSGEIPKDGWHHYGLAAPVYTHFTSPIRRYADVVVHRLLAAAIGVISLPPTYADRGKQQDLSAHLNRRHKAAQYVQRASVSLYTLLYFKDRPSVELAYILSINKEEDRLLVLAPKFGVEATISLEQVKEQLTASAVESSDDGNSVVFSNKEGQRVLKLSTFQRVEIHVEVKESNSGDRYLESCCRRGQRQRREGKGSKKRQENTVVAVAAPRPPPTPL